MSAAASEISVMPRISTSSNGTALSDDGEKWGIRAVYGAVALGTIASLMPLPAFARTKSEVSDQQTCLADFDEPPKTGFFDEKHVYATTFTAGSSHLKNRGIVFKTGDGLVIRQRQTEKLSGPSLLASTTKLIAPPRDKVLKLSSSTSTNPSLSHRVDARRVSAYTNLYSDVSSKGSTQTEVAQPQQSQLSNAITRLNHLAEKKEGWKGSQSVAMTDHIKSFTEQFLAKFFDAGRMSEPFIGLDSDGDVTLFWKNDKFIMDLSITSDGTYSFYADVAGDKHYEGDEISVAVQLPAGILAALMHQDA